MLSEASNSYLIERAEVSSAIEALKKNDFISLYGSLGHGKTLCARMIQLVLHSTRARPAFYLRKDQAELAEELHYITENYERPVIIIDDIFKFQKYWPIFVSLGRSKISIVATSRFNIFTSRESEINETFFEFEPLHLRVEGFTSSEREALVPLISQASLWGALTKSPNYDKANKIATTFKNNFADLLIGLMKSSDMIGRYKKELQLLKQIAPDCYDGVLLCIYLEFIGADPDINLLKDGFGHDISAFLARGDAGEFFKTFLLSDKSGIRYNSSIFSRYAIEDILDKDDLLIVIKDAVLTLIDSSGISGDFYYIFRELMRFNYLKSLCSDGNFDRLGDFYDLLSSEAVLNQNDLFWLQYGMLERARKDFVKARRHLYESRGYAKRKGTTYEPFQTENQLIACILEVGIYRNLTPELAFVDLQEAIDLLEGQLTEARSSQSEQAFQWHELLSSYLSTYLSRFSDDQARVIKGRLHRYVGNIKNKIPNWIRRGSAKKTVDTIVTYLRLGSGLTTRT